VQLSPSELPKRHDLAAWLQQRQALLQVAKTTKTPSGQTIDWVPIGSQTPGAIAVPPPSTPVAAPIDPKRPSKGAVFEPVEDGPPGHVPVPRPNLDNVPESTTLEQFLSKKGGGKVNPHRHDPSPGDPNPAGYFHASSGQTVTNLGCEAWYNVWDPKVDIPSSPGDDHSISQTWLQNYDKPLLQSLEAGLTVDHSLNGDASNHLFSYFTTNGYTKDGNNIGGYNRLGQGWHQVHATIFPGIRVNGSSTQGAGSQLEIGLKYQLFQGNWWLGFNNVEAGPWIWLGYYPASLFAGGIGNHASWASFGGEVFSALANPCTTTDQMGSGRHASTGYSHAAYQRNMRTQTNAAGAVVNFNGSPETDAAAAHCPANQYTIQCFMNSGGGWGSFQFFGGQAA
jgi:hypothetical protein